MATPRPLACPARDPPHACASAPSGVVALQKGRADAAAGCVLEINLDLHLCISSTTAAVKSVRGVIPTTTTTTNT